MERQRKIFIGKCAAILSAIPLLVYAHAFGPDPRKTGAPGDNPTACIQSGCHVGTVNQFSGSVTVNFPNGLTYTPGVKQHLIVTLVVGICRIIGKSRVGVQEVVDPVAVIRMRLEEKILEHGT
jgi:hypothetical protein